MKAPKCSLRKVVDFLNNPEEEGGFWLPDIQRNFVWDESQICRLFDSIMREYPISTLLVWKTKAQIRHRRFIDNYRSGIRLADLYVSPNDKKKCLVLDGQQRLQSLFIGLRGNYEGRELYLDILSGESAAPDDIKFKFAFRDPQKSSFPWVKFKDIVFDKSDYVTATKKLISGAGVDISDEDELKISRHVGIVYKTFTGDDGVSYQELDSIENEDTYTEDDVVEIFIRANSGGTKLEKSDLLFSLLSSKWEGADERMEDLLSDLNRHDFKFTRDFVLKSCLTLLNQKARYEVSKFRDPEADVIKRIGDEWQGITEALADVLDFVRGMTFIQSDKALPSYLALIPLAYARYRYPDNWGEVKNVDEYLLRALISGAFGGNPDQIIDDCVESINKQGGFNTDQIFNVIRSGGRSLELTEDRFWRTTGYGSNNIHLLFNLWYKGFVNYTPAYKNNLPQIDHIFPQSALKKIKELNPETGRSIEKYKKSDRNQLANCMLLRQKENGASGKSDTLPEEWFADKSDEYLEMHLIPRDRELWKMERFEDFIEKRKRLIEGKFSPYLFSKSEPSQA